MTEDYITQVSEEIEGRVTKKLSQELSRTESRIFGVLSKLDEFLLNRTYGLAPEPFRKRLGTTTQKTGNPLGIVPRVTPIPKWSSLFVRPALQMTQTGRRPPIEIESTAGQRPLELFQSFAYVDQ